MSSHTKRCLSITLSDDLTQISKKIKTGELSERRTRQLKAEAHCTPHCVDAEKATTQFAIGQWNKEQHKSIFFLTIVARQLFHKDAALRKSAFQEHRLLLNNKYIQDSRLCRVYASTGKKLDQYMVGCLFKAMSIMHLHNLQPQEDTLHRSIAPVIAAAHANPAKQVRYLSFFFEFSYLIHFESEPKMLKKYAAMDAASFANHCWKQQMLPVSPRFGQGNGQKSWYMQLLDYIKHGDKDSFTAKVVEIHNDRVMTCAESAVIAAICALPAEGRMPRAESFKRQTSLAAGLGKFYRKNMTEALIAHGIWQEPTPKEYAELADGPGAEAYWTGTGITRQQMLQYLHNTIDALGEESKVATTNFAKPQLAPTIF